MYIDRIWPFTTFISRNKHNKNIRLRLYWLRLRVAEAEVQTSHEIFIHEARLRLLRLNTDQIEFERLADKWKCNRTICKQRVK